METPIVVAIIASATALVAPVVTFIVTRAYEGKFLQPLSASRIAAVQGKWVGEALQTGANSSASIPASVIANIHVKNKKLLGKVSFRIKHENIENEGEFDISGGFLYERFLRLEYNPQGNSGIRFGSIVMELTENDERLAGRYVGYGAYSNEIVTGSLSLAKKH